MLAAFTVMGFMVGALGGLVVFLLLANHQLAKLILKATDSVNEANRALHVADTAIDYQAELIGFQAKILEENGIEIEYCSGSSVN